MFKATLTLVGHTCSSLEHKTKAAAKEEVARMVEWHIILGTAPPLEGEIKSPR